MAQGYTCQCVSQCPLKTTDSFTKITFLTRLFFNALHLLKNAQPIHLMPQSRKRCLSQVVFHALIAIFLKEEVSMLKEFSS